MTTPRTPSPAPHDASRDTAGRDLARLLLQDDEAPGAGPDRVCAPQKSVPIRLTATQAHRIARRGLSGRAVPLLCAYMGLGRSDVSGVLGLDRSTAHRKAARDEPLPPHATESLLRLLELDDLAHATFTTAQGAADWLRRPHPLLDGQAPVACAASSYGARRVREILVATRYGGVV